MSWGVFSTSKIIKTSLRKQKHGNHLNTPANHLYSLVLSALLVLQPGKGHQKNLRKKPQKPSENLPTIPISPRHPPCFKNPPETLIFSSSNTKKSLKSSKIHQKSIKNPSKIHQKSTRNHHSVAFHRATLKSSVKMGSCPWQTST